MFIYKRKLNDFLHVPSRAYIEQQMPCSHQSRQGICWHLQVLFQMFINHKISLITLAGRPFLFLYLIAFDKTNIIFI